MEGRESLLRLLHDAKCVEHVKPRVERDKSLERY